MEKRGVIPREFGRLRVQEIIRHPNLPTKCRCICTCGSEKVAVLAELRRGRTTSCGCVQRERSQAANTLHGMRGSPEYESWKGMRARCNNHKHPQYVDYGGRGIYVCAEWDVFPAFLEDMGPRPSDMTLDREDNNGPYAPWNCRWATRFTQARNRRDNRRITFAGRTLVLTDWALEFGISPDTLADRLAAGWSLAAAMQSRLPRLTDDEKRQRKNARSAVQYAVSVGKLLVPVHCDRCRQPRNLEGHHHKGYSQLHCLDVRWLCRECHELEESAWTRL